MPSARISLSAAIRPMGSAKYVVGLAAALMVALSPTLSGQVPDGPVRIRAFVVNMTNVRTGSNNVFEITLDQFSTAAERQDLIDTMTSGHHRPQNDHCAKIVRLSKARALSGGSGRNVGTTIRTA